MNSFYISARFSTTAGSATGSAAHPLSDCKTLRRRTAAGRVIYVSRPLTAARANAMLPRSEPEPPIADKASSRRPVHRSAAGVLELSHETLPAAPEVVLDNGCPAVEERRGADIGARGSCPITNDEVMEIEAELDNGEAVVAMRRFNRAIANLDADSWRPKMRSILREWSFSGEASMAIFTLVIFKIQCGIRAGERSGTDSLRRDNALKKLIQPIAGEYGMHNGRQQGDTHRAMFAAMYESLMGESFEAMLGEDPNPCLSSEIFEKMLSDLSQSGTAPESRTRAAQEASYALGYNLATEYLGDYEFKLMLPSFRALARKFVEGRQVNLAFIQLHAEGAEEEHAELGHEAIEALVPREHVAHLRRAVTDYDRELASWYHGLTDILEQ